MQKYSEKIFKMQVKKTGQWKKKQTEKIRGKYKYKTYMKERNKPKRETKRSVLLSFSRETASTSALSSHSPHPPSQSSDSANLAPLPFFVSRFLNSNFLSFPYHSTRYIFSFLALFLFLYHVFPQL
jgi:hypothetical protein